MDLIVQKRDASGKKVKIIRREGVIPGVVYGKYIDTPVLVSFRKQDFLKLYKEVGFASPFTLKGDGVDQLVLIHDVQVDPVTNLLLHVDFLTLKKGEKIKISIPVILEGEAPVEKLGEGQVQLVKSEIEIEAMPKDLPRDVKIDISNLKTTQDSILMKDIVLGKNVEILEDIEQPIVTVLSMSNDVEEEVEVGSAEVAVEIEETTEEKKED